MRPRFFSARVERALVRMYLAGSGTPQLSALTGVTVAGLCKLLRRNGVELRPRHAAQASTEAVLATYGTTRVYVAHPALHNVHSLMQRHGLSHADARLYWERLDPAYTPLLVWFDELDHPGLEQMLLHKTGGAARTCAARQCDVIRVPKPEADAFYTAHHLQGLCNGNNTYGLVYNDLLVACMTFNAGSACRGVAAEHLLQRFAVAGSIPGAASKLLTAFQKEHRGAILSYSDGRYAAGSLYETLGFQCVTVNDPDYRYYDPSAKAWFNKSRFQLKHLRPRMEAAGKDWTGLTEWEMAYQLGLHRCYELSKKTWLLPDDGFGCM